MDLEIIQKRDNPLLSRIEIEAEVNFFKESIPKKEDVKKKLASIEKSNENLVIVKNIYSSFGTGKADVLAYVYKSEGELKKIEPQKKEKETKKAEKAAPKEEAKEAPKKEEKKEGPKKEEAKEPEKKEAPKEEAKKG